MKKRVNIQLIILLFVCFATQPLLADCGTKYYWNGNGGNNWTGNNRWEDAGGTTSNTNFGAYAGKTGTAAAEATHVIVTNANGNKLLISAGTSFTVKCFEIAGGSIESIGTGNTETITVTGDYIKIPTFDSNFVDNTHVVKWVLDPDNDTNVQEIKVKGVLSDVQINSEKTTIIVDPLELDVGFSIGADADGGVLLIQNDLFVSAGAVTIPAGYKVIIKKGGSLRAEAGLTIDGTVVVEGGGQLRVGNGNALTISSTGLLKLNGNKGMPAIVGLSSATGSNGSYASGVGIDMNVNGRFYGDYFIITDADNSTTGVSFGATATIEKMDNGLFAIYENSASQYAMTINNSTTLTDTAWDNIGFTPFTSASVTIVSGKNINAHTTGSVITITNAHGRAGSATYENDTGNKITWSSQKAAAIHLIPYLIATSGTDISAENPIMALQMIHSTTDDNLTSGTDYGTITKFVYQLEGDIEPGDFSALTSRLSSFLGSCTDNTGAPTGTVEYDYNYKRVTVTTSIVAGDNGTHQPASCWFMTITPNTNIGYKKSVGLTLIGYEVEQGAGALKVDTDFSNFIPNVQSRYATQTATNTWCLWDGSSSAAWSTSGNWTGMSGSTCNEPDSTENTVISRVINGSNNPTLAAEESVNNLYIYDGATVEFLTSAERDLQINGSILYVGENVTFNNVNPTQADDASDADTDDGDCLEFVGATDTVVKMGTTWPGCIDITKTAESDTVTIAQDLTVEGRIEIFEGTLIIPDGVTLTVRNNIVIKAGGALKVAGGGTIIGEDSLINVSQAGAHLYLLGDEGKNENDETITLKYASLGSTAADTYIRVAVVGGDLVANHYKISNCNSYCFQIWNNSTMDTDSVVTNNLDYGILTTPDTGAASVIAFQYAHANSLSKNLTLSNVYFDDGGTGVTYTNISMNSSETNTITVNSYAGNRGGDTYETDAGNLVDWSSATDLPDYTIVEMNDASYPENSTVGVGESDFDMAHFKITNNSSDTAELRYLKLINYGTASINDISGFTLYLDNDCDQGKDSVIALGSKVDDGYEFSGMRPNIASGGGTACMIVSVDINFDATQGKTLGLMLSTQQGISVVGQDKDTSTFLLTSAVPLKFGTTTISENTSDRCVWQGDDSAAAHTTTNWSCSGGPDSTKDCIIVAPSGANNEIQFQGTAITCKNLVFTDNAAPTFSADTTVNVYGNIKVDYDLTLSQLLLDIYDGASATDQVIETETFTVKGLDVDNKNNGGTLTLKGTQIKVNNVMFWNTSPTTPNTVIIASGTELVADKGLRLNYHTLVIKAGGVLSIDPAANLGFGIDFIVDSAGTLKMRGVEDTLGPLSATASTAAQQITTYASTKAKLGSASTSSRVWPIINGGTLDARGFIFDFINSGLGFTFQSTASQDVRVLNMDYGAFTNIGTASTKNIWFKSGQHGNGSMDTTWTGVGFYFDPEGTIPANSSSYKLFYSAADEKCGATTSVTINIENWHANFEDNDTWTATAEANHITDIADGGTTTCDISFAAFSSPVSITSFTGTPYDGKVLLQWETGFERDHLGFNVYRSNADGSEFLRINDSLIRNDITSSSLSGKYYFVDEDVVNGQTYYYYVEDIPVMGAALPELHGPVTVTPLGGLGNPPGAAGDENNGGSNSNDGNASVNDPSTISNPSFKDLGDGVQILSQTSSSLRLKIAPGAVTFSASSWDASYNEAAIDGYSKTLTVSEPELLERVLLIEVNPFVTSAELTSLSINAESTYNKLMAPAPSWAADINGILQPSYAIDTLAYANTSFDPTAYISVDSTLVSVANKKFLKIIVSPLKYKASTNDIEKLDEAILDIGLNGNAWDVNSPDSEITIEPEAFANTLKIGFTTTGMHEVTYDNLVNSSVEGPFDGVDIADLRLYYHGSEHSLEVVDADASGTLTSGDKLRMYLTYENNIDDKTDYAVLSTVEFKTDGDNALRMDTINGDPTGSEATAINEVLYSKTFEENNKQNFRQPIGTGVDHYFWKQLYGPIPGNAAEYLEFSARLTGLDNTSAHQVAIKVTFIGEPGLITRNITHSVELSINGTVTNTETFMTQKLRTVTYNVDASEFVDGNNTIKFRVLGDQVPAGDWDIVWVDKIEVDYFGTRKANANDVTINNTETDVVIQANNFTNSDVLVYDISNASYPAIITNGVVTTSDAGATYDVDFLTSSVGSEATKYYAMTSNAFYSPATLSLSEGYASFLKDTTNEADLIIIGQKHLLDATDTLVAQRESQGLKVYKAELNQIYDEFSNGRVTSRAIKDFLTYARSNWTGRAFSYVLILGDATKDPLDINGNGMPKGSMPAAIAKGTYTDFGSDNYYVMNSDDTPYAAIGRIPTNDEAELSDFISKLLLYEDGTLAPINKSLAFFSGEVSSDVEKFIDQNNTLKYLEILETSTYTSIHRAHKYDGGDAGMNTIIMEQFAKGHFIMNYMGHGGYNLWSSNSMFHNSDTDSLTNTDSLPVIISLSCYSTKYWEDDQSKVSLGEKLLYLDDTGSPMVIGASTLSTPNEQMAFAKRFYSYIGEETAKPYYRVTMGELFQRAKISASTTGNQPNMYHGFTILGDPSMPIPRSQFSGTISKGHGRINSSSGGGGCGAIANDGQKTNPYGIIEWLLLIAAMFVPFKLARFVERLKK